MVKKTCLTCARCEYIHEYEVHWCDARKHPIRDELVECEDECDFYEQYVEEE